MGSVGGDGKKNLKKSYSPHVSVGLDPPGVGLRPSAISGGAPRCQKNFAFPRPLLRYFLAKLGAVDAVWERVLGRTVSHSILVLRVISRVSAPCNKLSECTRQLLIFFTTCRFFSSRAGGVGWGRM